MDDEVSGATSNIYQSLITTDLGDPFEHIQFRDSRRGFQFLGPDIALLGHPWNRNHANIIKIQGSCWNIPQDGEDIRPVLVF